MSGGRDRVLITGGAGLLGAALVRHLLAAGGHDITVMDLAETPARLAPLIGKISYLRGDIGHFSHLADAMRASRARRIYHLGALLGFACENDPPEAMRVNAMGAFHVFEAARMFGAQVVFASSVTTFAEGLPEPLLRDDFPQRPVNLYGVLKQTAEGLGRYYRARHGVDFRAIRFPSVIGPGPRLPGLATYSVEMAEAVAQGAPFTVRATPETTVPVVHVRDAARALAQLAGADPSRLSRRCYLIDGPKPALSAGAQADILRARFPGADIRFAPDPHWQPFLEKYALPIDDSPARRDWGWAPGLDFHALVNEVANGPDCRG